MIDYGFNNAKIVKIKLLSQKGMIFGLHLNARITRDGD
jgi:hypothetical protein